MIKKTHLAAIYLTISLVLVCVEPVEVSTGIVFFQVLMFMNLANAIRYANKQFREIKTT